MSPACSASSFCSCNAQIISSYMASLTAACSFSNLSFSDILLFAAILLCLFFSITSRIFTICSACEGLFFCLSSSSIFCLSSFSFCSCVILFVPTATLVDLALLFLSSSSFFLLFESSFSFLFFSSKSLFICNAHATSSPISSIPLSLGFCRDDGRPGWGLMRLLGLKILIFSNSFSFFSI